MRRTYGVLLLAATFGCGATAVEPANAPAAAPIEAAAPSIPEPDELPPPLPAFARAADVVWIEEPRFDGVGQVVMSEEIAVVDEALQRALERSGLTVVPVRERQIAIARMRAGYLPDRRGRCEAMPAPARYLDARYGDVPGVRSSLTCSEQSTSATAGTGECRWRVEMGRPDSLRAFERSLPLGTTVEGLAATIEGERITLAPTANPAGLGALIGPSGLAAAVDVGGLETSGAWSVGQLANLSTMLRRVLAPQQSLLQRCMLEAPRFDVWANDLSIEVSPTGRVTRCEAALADHLLQPTEACACGPLRDSLDLGPAEGVRRMRFEVSVRGSGSTWSEPTTHVVARARARVASDPTVLLGGVDDGAFQRCVRAGPLFAERRVVLDLEVGADGRVAESAAAAFDRDELPEDVLRCVADAAGTLRLTCPFSGSARVRIEVVLSRTPRAHAYPPDSVLRAASDGGIELAPSLWHNDAPDASPAVAWLTADGRLVEGDATTLRRALQAGQPLGLVIDRRAPVERLEALLRDVGVPASGRIYVAVGRRGSWRALFVESSNDRRAVVAGVRVEEMALSRDANRIESSDPEVLAGAIDADSSEPTRLVVRPGTSFAALVRAMDAADVHDRRPVLVLGASGSTP